MKKLTAIRSLCLVAALAAPMMGQGIYTTTALGTTVNGNLYDSKSDVYLTGGPNNCNGPGLPTGTYYFQVTDPAGQVLLSSDSLADRTVTTSGGFVTGYSGVTHSVNSLLTGCISPKATSQALVQLMPFNDTPNNGGEYKVLLTDAACSGVIPFDPLHPNDYTGLLVKISQGPCFAKTDNFKVKVVCTPGVDCPLPPDSLLSGVKYYDSDRNGVQNGSETGVAGVRIVITHGSGPTVDAVLTDQFGGWFFAIPNGDTFSVCEDKTVAPFISGLWEQTGPLNGATDGTATANNGCWSGPAGQDFSDLSFGNVAKIKGTKYYDSNADGDPDLAEPTIDGFTVNMCENAACPGGTTATTVTGPNGGYSFYLQKQDSNFRICEGALPVAGSGKVWQQTGPLNLATPFPANTGSGTAAGDTVKCWTGSGPVNGLYLTNVCLGSGGGLTLGFWSNKNGQALFGADDLALMVTLNLRNANGTAFDPANYAAFRTWILGATATNMAYMLSAQLAAMELNVNNGFVSASALIYAPGTNSANAAGFATVGAIMTEANTELGLHGTAVAGNAWRSYQEALKNALDKANNNLTFVLGPAACTPAANQPPE